MEWVNFQDFLSGGYAAARELADDRKVILYLFLTNIELIHPLVMKN